MVLMEKRLMTFGFNLIPSNVERLRHS